MKVIQDEVRRSLTKYALLPVMFLGVVGLVLIGASWQYYVAGLSEERREVAAEVLDSEIRDYEARAHTWQSWGFIPLTCGRWGRTAQRSTPISTTRSISRMTGRPSSCSTMTRPS